jgi:hypothetical protein
MGSETFEQAEKLIQKTEAILVEVQATLRGLKEARDAAHAGTTMTASEALEVLRKVALSRVSRRESVEFVEDGTRCLAYWFGDADTGKWRLMWYGHNTYESHPGEDAIIRSIEAATMFADDEGVGR